VQKTIFRNPHGAESSDAFRLFGRCEYQFRNSRGSLFGGLDVGFLPLQKQLPKGTSRNTFRSGSRPFGLLLVTPLAAHAHGTPFDTGFTALQTLFTGTVAKVASLIAIVIGG
jgi:hypothetical protein